MEGVYCFGLLPNKMMQVLMNDNVLDITLHFPTSTCRFMAWHQSLCNPASFTLYSPGTCGELEYQGETHGVFAVSKIQWWIQRFPPKKTDFLILVVGPQLKLNPPSCPDNQDNAPDSTLDHHITLDLLCVCVGISRASIRTSCS